MDIFINMLGKLAIKFSVDNTLDITELMIEK